MLVAVIISVITLRYLGKVSAEEEVSRTDKKVEVRGPNPRQGFSYYYFYNTTIALSHALLSIEFLPKK